MCKTKKLKQYNTFNYMGHATYYNTVLRVIKLKDRHPSTVTELSLQAYLRIYIYMYIHIVKFSMYILINNTLNSCRRIFSSFYTIVNSR